jgi:hypothetical protein
MEQHRRVARPKVARMQGIRRPSAPPTPPPAEQGLVTPKPETAEPTPLEGKSESRLNAVLNYARSRSWRWWTAVGLAALVGLGLVARQVKDDGSSDSGSTADMAIVACEDFVEDRLKAPSSADFGTPTAESNEAGTWLVIGTVDSENSFGAMMRVSYRCTVSNSGGDTWTLVDLQHHQR